MNWMSLAVQMALLGAALLTCCLSTCTVVARPAPARHVPAAGEPCFASAAAGQQRLGAVSVSDNSSAAERFAAQELAEHLSNISGVAIPVLRSAVAQGTNHIAVGYNAALQVGLDPARLGCDQLGDENFTAAAGVPASQPGGGARAGMVALSGCYGSPRGTLYAVYTFLEQLGVRWWAPDETFLPACFSPERFIWACEELWYDDQAAGVAGSVPLQTRQPGTWTSMNHPLWSLRMRLNADGWDRSVVAPPSNHGVFWANASLGRGGVVGYTGLPGSEATIFNLLEQWPLVDGCKAVGGSASVGGCYSRPCGEPAGGNPTLCPPYELCKAHPDWFWPRDCAASGGQVCWSAPGLTQYLINRSLTLLRANSFTTAGDRAASRAAGRQEKYFSITQMDGTNQCMAPGELAAAAAEGGAPAGPQLRAVNAIADAIRAEFPEITIETFAYEFSQKPPNVTTPRENVIIKLAPINANFGAPFFDASNTEFLNDFLGWRKIAPQLSLWSYPTNYGTFGQFKPWPSWFVTAQNVQFAAKNKVSWIYLESTTSANGAGGLGLEMEPLRAYLTASMMYHPAQDWAEVAQQFLSGFYGEGAFGVQQYIDAFGGAEASAHSVMSQYDPKYDSPTGPNNATFLRDPFLTPTAILTAARGLTEAQRVVARLGAENATRRETLLRRLDAAKMPTLLVLLYRWEELRSVSVARGEDWPLAQSTLVEAYAEWSRLYAEFRMQFGGSLDCCGSSSAFWQMVFNRSSTINSLASAESAQ